MLKRAVPKPRRRQMTPDRGSIEWERRCWAGRGGGFGRSPLRTDLPTLQQVAQRTGGIAYTAQDGSQLPKVFTTLPKDVTVSKERHDVSSTFVLLGALLAVVATVASIRWSPHP
jgi:hypothetical protein